MGARLRRERRGARSEPRRGAALALIALLALLLPLRAQTEHGAEEARVEAWIAQLASEQAADAARELAQYWTQKRPLLEGLAEGPGRRDQAYALTLADFTLADGDPSSVGRTAEELLRDARVCARVAGDAEFEAQARWRLASLLEAGGRMAEAERELEEACRELEAARGMRPWLLASRASLALGRGDTRAAEALLDQAEAALDPDPALAAQARLHLDGLRAQLLLALGLPDVAAPLVARELAAAAPERDLAQYQTALLHLSNLKLALEDFEGLEQELAPLVTSEAVRATPAVAATLELALGLARFELEREDGARSHGAAETLARVAVDPALWDVDRFSAELALADVQLHQGELDAARAQLRTAREHMQRLVATDALSVARTDQAWLCALDSRLARARGVSARELGERLAELDAAYAGFLDEWAAAPQREGGLGFLRYGARRRAVLCELVALLRAAHGPEQGAREGFERVLAAQTLGSLAQALAPLVEARLAPGPEVRGADRIAVARALLERAQRRLQGSFFVYLPGPDGGQVFGLSPQGVRVCELPPNFVIEPLRRRFVASLAGWTAKPEGDKGQRAEIEALGKRLSEALLPAELLASRGELLGIVGLDLLGYLPFEALPIGEKRLGDDCGLYYLPSLPVGLLLEARAPAKGPEGELGLIGLPRISDVARARWPGLAPIELDERERSQLESSAFARAPLVRWNEAATRAAFFELWSRGLNVLHVFTHGIYDSARELPAGILLTSAGEDGGLLWCDELPREHAPALVILSACGVGRGRLRHGDDGIGGFSGRCLLAGSQAVLLSPLDLEAHGTAALTSALLAGGSRSLAQDLRAARARIARERKDPFSASLVHLVGLGQAQILPPRPAGTRTSGGYAAIAGLWIAVALALALLAGLALFLRRRLRSG